MRRGWSGARPASRATMAAAQTLAWALAANAAFAIAPMMAASPSTWMPGCIVDSNVTGSTGHQPVRSATPAWVAMAAAFCGGGTMATDALWLSKSGMTVSGEGAPGDAYPAPMRGAPCAHPG